MGEINLPHEVKPGGLEDKPFENITEKTKPRVAIIGAGVIGLTNAILAQEAGYQVTIYSDLSPSDTTTIKAAALFMPFAVPFTPEVLQMAEESWSYYNALEQKVGTEVTGVRRHTHWEVTTDYRDPKGKPYLAQMEDVTEIDGDPELTPGKYNHGIKYTTFFIETPIYVPYLVERFKQNGGLFVNKHFTDSEEFDELEADIIFNCTGLGARDLMKDEKVSPLRGQVVHIGPQPELLESNVSISHEDSFYVLPQPATNRTIIGGTVVEDWNDQVDPSTTKALVKANRRILPQLTQKDVQRAIVGLRPYRSDNVRIEAEERGDKLIIHNYGHGGAGITLAWGSGRLALDKLK